MSAALARLLERASTDAGFRAWFESDPEAALADYELAPEERAALLSGDPRPLHLLGVDARLSKWASAQTSISEQDAMIDWLKQW